METIALQLDQNKTPILDAITNFIKTDPAYFRIPGHRLSEGISSRWTDLVGKEIFAYDVTETPLTDDLHSPEGAVEEAQKLYADLYGVTESFLLVNGTTCGNEAMILTAVQEGDEIMIARNAHKSALMGCILSGAKPIYCMPEIIEDWGLQGGISPQTVEETFQAHPNCKALFLVSPSYYGITSDLEKIADICHKHHALLLVDEAHGGHMHFHDDLPVDAMQAGADMCVQSMHKITGALTQSSVLHVRSSLVNMELLRKNLHLVQSTSPNYLLMTSLDCARYELAKQGKEMMQKALELCQWTRKQIAQIPGFCCMDMDTCAKYPDKINDLDMTRLVISAMELGLTGFALDELLFEQYQVNMELSDAQNVLAVVTYANQKKDMERLVEACRDIASTYGKKDKMKHSDQQYPVFPAIPEQAYTPRAAYFSQMEEIPWEDAVGMISGEMIAPYPPGIPVVYPGERITKEIWDYLTCFKNDHRHIHGSKNGKLETIQVIRE